MAGGHERRRGLRRWAFRWLGPALFAGLWWTTDLGQVRDLAGRARPWPLLGAAVINAVLVVIKAWRWREIMKIQSIDYAYAPAARAYSIACAVAAWTPGRLGDFVKAVTVSRERGVSFGKAASSVIADRLLDALALTLVAAGGAGLLIGPVAATITWCLLALSAVLGWILVRWAADQGRERATRAFRRVGLGRAGDELGDALVGLNEMTRPSGRRQAALAGGATILATAATFLQGWLVALSLGIPVPFLTLSAALAGASIAALLPLTVSGIGIREATLAFYLSPAGLGLAEVLAYSVAFLLVVNGSAALIGALTQAFWPARGAGVAATAAGTGADRA